MFVNDDETTLIPRRATFGSAGYDFFAPHDIELNPGQWTEIDTRIRLNGSSGVMQETSERIEGNLFEVKMNHPNKWVLLVFPRSGLGFKYGVRFSNTVGVIDMDYRDNIRAKMTCDIPCTIKKDTAFMQGIIIPFATFSDEIPPTKERDGGFGSTDKG